MPALRPAAVLALALLAGLAGRPAQAQELGGEVALVRVEKAARRLVLLDDRGGIVRAYSGIQLGDAPQGPKRFAGDERTPEGRYTIDWGNPASAYHLSLHISYPSAADRALASAAGRSAGGAIFIHGQPNSLQNGRIAGDWTDGCIAVSNAEIEEIWTLVGDGTPIELVP